MENVKRDHQGIYFLRRDSVKGREFSRGEEICHAITHGIGALLGILGALMLLIKVSGFDALSIFAASVYGASLVILYSASCAYHISSAVFGSKRESRVREFFMKCDHSMIFFLILGTYTPACLVTLRGPIGFTVFGIGAACCILGIVLNVINVRRFKKISLFLNLLSGWMIVIAFYPYYTVIGQLGSNYLILGGILYTVGVLFYKKPEIRYTHVIWHFFVLAGSLAHYVMVYFFCF